MKQRKRMDETMAIPQPNTDNRRGLAIVQNQPIGDETEKPNELSWLGRRLADLGVIVMASAKPSGWNLNPTTITAYIVILGAILAAIGAISGGAYYLGYKDREMMELREQLKETKEKAEQAKALSISAASNPGHDDKEEKEKPKKK